MPTAPSVENKPTAYPMLFIAHGGGPLPITAPEDNAELLQAWRDNTAEIVKAYGRPKAIAVVSGHYYRDTPTVGGDPRPELLYDYSAYPPQAFHLKYPNVTGDPALAARMAAAFRRELGDSAVVGDGVEHYRPLDHGVFVPLLTMFPDIAGIPVVPICVLNSDDPHAHVAMGRALSEFRKEGVFFIGSGSSFHNFWHNYPDNAGKRFNDAITAIITNPKLTPAERIAAAADHMTELDGFDEAQPKGAYEHLTPLYTLLGIARGGVARDVAEYRLGRGNGRHWIFEGETGEPLKA